MLDVQHCVQSVYLVATLLQIKLLRILGLLGAADKAASDNMYAVIADSMRRANTGHTIGNAIVYEAVRTITAIYPNPALLQSGTPWLLCAFGLFQASRHNVDGSLEVGNLEPIRLQQDRI